MFLTLEGIDGSGKNTQSELLLRHFQEIEGLRVTKFDLPKYESITGAMIKDHLKGLWKVTTESVDQQNPPLYMTDPSTYLFQCCQLVNRMETLPDGLWNQGQNDVFIADRYNASAYAYGVAFGMDFEWLIKTHRHLPQPDLNILLDIPIEESFRRRPERRDNYEKNVAMLETVRKSYLDIFSKLGPSYVVIDAAGTREETFAKMIREIYTNRRDPAKWASSSPPGGWLSIAG